MTLSPHWRLAMDTNRSEQGQLIEAEQQRELDRPLPSALGAGCCPECGAPLRWGHIKIKWTIGARTFEMPCPMA